MRTIASMARAVLFLLLVFNLSVNGQRSIISRAIADTDKKDLFTNNASKYLMQTSSLLGRISHIGLFRTNDKGSVASTDFLRTVVYTNKEG